MPKFGAESFFCCNFAAMKIHVFNPEHDIALATNVEQFTAPHAGRQLRSDLGFLPALWADDGDMVVVDDIEAALHGVRHLKRKSADVLFVMLADLKHIGREKSIPLSVWGMDISIRKQLLDAGIPASWMLEKAALNELRDISNRRWASSKLLPRLVEKDEHFVGSAEYITRLEDLTVSAGGVVLKAPWSSSGRGIRYMQQLDTPVARWAQNVIRRQGGLMVEPFYHKVKDFGMELMAQVDGSVEYSGLSLFKTENGAYIGNILATEDDKRRMMANYVDLRLLDRLEEEICLELSSLLQGKYHGPLGIDMMIVAQENHEGFLLHPCVEMNLRRTMGHVALALSPTSAEPQGIMRISYHDKYHLRVINTNENLVNTTVY